MPRNSSVWSPTALLHRRKRDHNTPTAPVGCQQKVHQTFRLGSIPVQEAATKALFCQARLKLPPNLLPSRSVGFTEADYGLAGAGLRARTIMPFFMPIEFASIAPLLLMMMMMMMTESTTARATSAVSPTAHHLL